MRKTAAIATIAFLGIFFLDKLGLFDCLKGAGHSALGNLYAWNVLCFALLVLLLNVLSLFKPERPVECAAAGEVSVAKIIGYVGLCVMFSLMVVLGGSIGSFFDVPSFVLVLGITYFALLLSYGGSANGFLRHSLRAFFCQGGQSHQRYSEIAKWGGIYAFAAGLLVCVMGLVQVFDNIPELPCPTFFQALNICLLPALYGGLFNLFVFMPLYKMWGQEECR